MWESEELRATLRMIEAEHLDIRAVTMGISLRDCATDDLHRTCQRVYDKVTRSARRLVAVAKEVEGAFGVPITNKRISVTPIALVGEPTHAASYVPLAETLDRAGAELGIDYVAGFSAHVEKGATPGDLVLLDSIPEALSVTQRVCSSINVATTRAGINMDAIAHMGRIIKALAERTADRGGIGCAKLVVFANIPDDNPFVAGALHGIGEGDRVLNVGVSGPGVVLSAIRRLRESGRKIDLGDVAETVKRMAFKVTRAGELIGREVAARLGDGVRFGIVDLSLAPTPAIGDSVAEILEAIGLERTGAPGTTAALALLTDAVKKGGVMASSSVGGLSGAFIPVSEDHGMIEAVEVGALSL
ncbi:MAG TPA: PFL family protein, partial [Polyangia bacterium]